MKSIPAVVLVLLVWLAFGTGSHAQVPVPPSELLPESHTPLHPWQVPVPRFNAEAYFTNLQNGAKIETPFHLTFGLAGGWGLAPIAKPMSGKSGHHHLVLSRDLPLDFEKALPFNDKYIHFGKGQMETVLNLEPGKYALRLLLANSNHVLHFVYSKPVEITVTRRNKDIDPKSLLKKGISLLNMVPDAILKPPFRVQFHASGLNVAHLSQKEKDTGHFRLTLTSLSRGKHSEMAFVNGQTETWLAPPPGTYSMKLDFMDNNTPGKTMADSVAMPIRVE
ncbi:MAG: DUF4399 domain-containing protein [Cellvibrio sp.]|uniref:DUF4399 domain-containing protein n=1 Tax=Cellvibrio sp. TaxID=1965322 RepID=UPI00271ACF84|nr:DUF4399 domain-containing protein [Cellvibrio sp.]